MGGVSIGGSVAIAPEELVKTGPVFAVLGDSITALMCQNTSTSQSYNSYGYGTWLRILSGQRIHLPVTHNFGVAGERLDQIRLRVDDVLAVHPQYCVVLAGTNDIGTRTVPQMVEDAKAIYERLITGGVRPIVMPILPRSSLATDQLQKLMRFNTWLREYTRTNKWIVLVDPTPLWIDYADTNGDPLTDYTTDGLHPSHLGAFYLGKALSDAISDFVPEQKSYVQSMLDIYDADNYPEGNLLTNGTLNYGVMQGTSGTKTSSGNFTASGDVATGWTCSKSNSTSTMAATCSKEDPRTDGPKTGARQKCVIAVTAAGGANELVLFTPTISSADIAEGDQIFAQAKVEVSGMTNVLSVELRLTDNRSSANQNNHDGAWAGTTDIFLADDWSGVLRTQPLEIASDSTSVTMNIAVRLDTSGGDGGATIYISDVSLRKVSTTL